MGDNLDFYLNIRGPSLFHLEHIRGCINFYNLFSSKQRKDEKKEKSEKSEKLERLVDPSVFIGPSSKAKAGDHMQSLDTSEAKPPQTAIPSFSATVLTAF